MTTATEDKNLAQITENMSEVNPDVLANRHAEESRQDAPSPAPQAAPKSGPKDRQGRTFDPALHEVDAEGNPRMNRDGFLACKPGRPGKTAKIRSEYPGQPKPEPQPSAQPQASAEDMQRRNTAMLSTQLFLQVGVGFFGEEWLPQKVAGMDERENLVKLFDDYYRSVGMSDIPPGWALALGLAGYGAARLHLPKTRSRFQVVVDHAKNFLARMAFRVMGLFKKVKGVKIHAPHAHPGNDGKRQDDPGPQAGETVSDAGNPGSGS